MSRINQVIGLAMVWGLFTAGCSSPPAEVAPQATGHLGALRDQLLVAKVQVQSASNAAKRPHRPATRQDLTPQMRHLQSTVRRVANATRAQARDQAQAFQESSAEYFQKWDAMLGDVSSDTADKGQERMAKAKEATERLRADIADVRTEVSPFMADLNEANKYLGTDTTASGLEIVKPKLKSATKREPAILKAIDKLIADIDSVRSGK